MSKALAIVNQQTPPPKKKREKIGLIETQPEADWFVPAKTKRGRQVWYLRFKMTGLHARLFGPFASKRVGLLFLDDVIESTLDSMSAADDYANDRRIKEEFTHAWMPLVEHPIVARPQAAMSKGAGR